jgi:hypothetical protein
MLQHGYQFSVNLMTFIFKKKVIKYSIFIFFSHLCKILNQKKGLIMTCVFDYFQSHCHIF